MGLVLNFECSRFFNPDFSIGSNFPRTRFQRNTFNRIFSLSIFIQAFKRNRAISLGYLFILILIGLVNFFFYLFKLCFGFNNLGLNINSFRFIKHWLWMIITVSNVSQFILKVFYFVDSFIQFIQNENITDIFIVRNILFITIRESTSVTFTDYHWLISMLLIGLL